MYPHSIVIINRLQGHRGSFELYPTIIHKAHYQDLTGVKLGNTGNITSTEGYVQIPTENKGYLPPNEWKELTNKAGKWTIQEHDMVLKGAVDLTLIDPQSIDKIAGIRTIERFEFIDYGISVPWHWGVYLK